MKALIRPKKRIGAIDLGRKGRICNIHRQLKRKIAKREENKIGR